MRRIAVLAMCVWVLSPASTSAEIQPTRSEGDLIKAMWTGVAAGTQWFALPPNGNPSAVSDVSLGGFPRDGPTYVILSSGDATQALPGGAPSATNGGDPTATRPDVFDVTTLVVGTREPGANCIAVTFRFLTSESPGSHILDGFIAELGGSDWTSTPGGAIVAPRNIAYDSAGGVLNTESSGETRLSPEEASGTGYGMATVPLTAAAPIPGDWRYLYLSVFDRSDALQDSAVFIDHFVVLPTRQGGCPTGARSDGDDPIVAIDAPAQGSASSDRTPVINGSGGTAARDASRLTLTLYSGGSVAGNPVQTLPVTVNNGRWSREVAPLPPGLYTARAEQVDASGNVGRSPAVTFRVDAPPSVGQPNVQVTGPAPAAGRPTAPRKRRRLRFDLQGGLGLPAGLRKSRVCFGKVAVRVKHKRRLIAAQTVRLNRRCRWHAIFRISRQRLRKARRLKYTARFRGNRYLARGRPKRGMIPVPPRNRG